jgi:hypothetical protein
MDSLTEQTGQPALTRGFRSSRLHKYLRAVCELLDGIEDPSGIAARLVTDLKTDEYRGEVILMSQTVGGNRERYRAYLGAIRFTAPLE